MISSRKILFSTLIFLISHTSYGWVSGGKVSAQTSSADNVNLTSTSPTKDHYTTLTGYLQTKNDTFKLKLKGRTEKYNSQNTNNNYHADLSLQYRRSNDDDYTFALFKQSYNGPTIVSTDTTSDNTGFRFSADFSKSYIDNGSAYASLKGSLKKYSKIIGRTDQTFGGALGLEHYLFSNLLINPEINLQRNKSSHLYYSNLVFYSNLLISFSLNDSWEFFTDAGYAKTNYSGRTVAAQNAKETQSLVSYDVGSAYKITKNIALQISYSSGKNSSNNPTSIYQNKTLALSLSLKF